MYSFVAGVLKKTNGLSVFNNKIRRCSIFYYLISFEGMQNLNQVIVDILVRCLKCLLFVDDLQNT